MTGLIGTIWSVLGRPSWSSLVFVFGERACPTLHAPTPTRRQLLRRLLATADRCAAPSRRCSSSRSCSTSPTGRSGSPSATGSPASTAQAYYEFENAFPLADLWLGVACVLALVALRRRSATQLLWLLCAGSAGLYLFGMDFLYDVEHGIFAKGGGGAFEALIVALTLVFSMTLLTWSWRHRAELLAGMAGSDGPDPRDPEAKLAEIEDQLATMKAPPDRAEQHLLRQARRRRHPDGGGPDVAGGRGRPAAGHRDRRTPRAGEARRGQLRPLRRVRPADPRGSARGAAVGDAVRRGRRRR